MDFRVKSKDIQLGSMIQKGSFGKIYHGQFTSSEEYGFDIPHTVVCKEIDRTVENREYLSFCNEVVIMNMLKEHPNFVRYYGWYQTEHVRGIIMEEIEGETLYDQLKKREESWRLHGITPTLFSEDEARRIFRQILIGVNHMHSKNIVHIDLKLENIMITTSSRVQLIDFGLSEVAPEGEDHYINKGKGSVEYAAPEILLGEPYCGRAADVWTLGVMLYASLLASFPYSYERRVNDCRKYHKHPDLELNTIECKLSSSVYTLLGGMLELDPEKRIKIREIMNHPWITQESDDVSGILECTNLINLINVS